jgi:hypothetical protein
MIAAVLYSMCWSSGVAVGVAVGVTDKGEPGTNDFFSIQFSNGYSASGYPLN